MDADPARRASGPLAHGSAPRATADDRRSCARHSDVPSGASVRNVNCAMSPLASCNPVGVAAKRAASMALSKRLRAQRHGAVHMPTHDAYVYVLAARGVRIDEALRATGPASYRPLNHMLSRHRDVVPKTALRRPGAEWCRLQSARTWLRPSGCRHACHSCPIRA